MHFTVVKILVERVQWWSIVTDVMEAGAMVVNGYRCNGSGCNDGLWVALKP